jgi:predicted transcriptional regulator of viral defense system
MDEPLSIPSATVTQLTGAARDRRIAEIAHDQWTMITLPQLQSLGLTASGVRMRVAAGRLHRRYRGVYSVGHDITPWQGYFMAAVLACGEGAVASHEAAGRILGLLENAGRLHVTVPGRRVRIAGIDTHMTSRLAPDEVTIEDRIPCTSVARTIVDVAERGDRRRTERMMDRAEQLRIFDLVAIQRVLDRGGGRSGTRLVRSLLGTESGGLTRNELEERFFGICESAGLPRPHVNLPIVLDDGGPHVVADFAWPELKLVVETDGWTSHGTRLAFVEDRRRDRRLAKAGWQPYHFAWEEVEHEPARVEDELGLLRALAS